MRNPKTAWLSVKRIKLQEFKETLRYIRGLGEGWADIYLRLGELQKEAWVRLSKQLPTMLILIIILLSLGGSADVSIAYQGVTASIKTGYVTLAASVVLFVTLQQIQVIEMLLMIRARHSAKHRLSRFSANAFGFYRGQDELALAVPIAVLSFIKPTMPVFRVMTAMIAVVYLTFLLPLFGVYLFVFKSNLAAVRVSTGDLLGLSSAYLGLLVSIITVAYFGLFYLPLPYKKDAHAIRWGFLSSLYAGKIHPHAFDWLDDRKDSKGNQP